MVGGFLDVYLIDDPFGDDKNGTNRPDIKPGHQTFVEKIAGGGATNLAWIFDGTRWTRMPPMSTGRDSPACSLVQIDDEKVRFKISNTQRAMSVCSL